MVSWDTPRVLTICHILAIWQTLVGTALAFTSNRRMAYACKGSSLYLRGTFYDAISQLNSTADFFFYKETDGIDFRKDYLVSWNSGTNKTDIKSELTTVVKPYEIKMFPLQDDDAGTYMMLLETSIGHDMLHNETFNVTVQSPPQLQSDKLELQVYSESQSTSITCGVVRSFGNPPVKLTMQSFNRKNNTNVDVSIDVGYLQTTDQTLLESGNILSCHPADDNPNLCIPTTDDHKWRASIMFGEMEFAHSSDDIMKRPVVIFATVMVVSTIVVGLIGSAFVKKRRNSSFGSGTKTTIGYPGIPLSQVSNTGGSTQDEISDISDVLPTNGPGSSTSI